MWRPPLESSVSVTSYPTPCFAHTLSSDLGLCRRAWFHISCKAVCCSVRAQVASGGGGCRRTSSQVYLAKHQAVSSLCDMASFVADELMI